MRDWHSSSFQHGLSSLHERGAFAGPVLSVSAGASPPCHLRSSHSLPPVPSPFSVERPCLPLMIVISPLSFFTSPTPENPICPPEVLSLVKGNPACQLKQGVMKNPQQPAEVVFGIPLGIRRVPHYRFLHPLQKLRSYASIFQAFSSLMVTGIIGTIPVPGLPFLSTQNSSPSFLLLWNLQLVKFLGLGFSILPAGPSPLPDSP